MSTLISGHNRPPGQHPSGDRVPQHAVPDAEGAAARANAAAGHGRQRRVQEPAVAVRADAARGRGLRAVQCVLALGNIA